MCIRDRLPPKKMIGNVAIITEDRRVDGLALEMSVKDNMTSANLKNLTGKVPGLLDKKKELEVCERYVKELETKVASLNQPISTLSGGNPVSYTHLDVYKRQLLCWQEVLGLWSVLC